MHVLYHQGSMVMLIYNVNWKIMVFYPVVLFSMGFLLIYAHTAHDKLEKLQRKIWRDKSQIKNETINGNSTIKAFGQQNNAVS